jgi:hypothetical protein
VHLGQDLVAVLDEPLGEDLDHIPRVVHAVPEPPDAVVPAVNRIEVGEHAARAPLGIGSDVLDHPVEVAAIPRLISLPCDPDSLRGHRVGPPLPQLSGLKTIPVGTLGKK